MCAFYFAAQRHQGFQSLAHEHQNKLERQSQILAATPGRQNPTTKLFADPKVAKCPRDLQAAAQRLKVPFDRVQRGDKQLPLWDPLLLPGDAPIQEIDQWIFPAPWTVIEGRDPTASIRIAKSTPKDPITRSRIIETSGALAGVPPPATVFWKTHRGVKAPATKVCEKMDVACAAPATAASNSAARGGPSLARAASGTKPHVHEAPARSTPTVTARPSAS